MGEVGGGQGGVCARGQGLRVREEGGGGQGEGEERRGAAGGWGRRGGGGGGAERGEREKEDGKKTERERGQHGGRASGMARKWAAGIALPAIFAGGCDGGP